MAVSTKRYRSVSQETTVFNKNDNNNITQVPYLLLPADYGDPADAAVDQTKGIFKRIFIKM